MISGTGSHKHTSTEHKNTTTAEKHLVFLLAEGKDCPFKSEKYRNKCISDAGAAVIRKLWGQHSFWHRYSPADGGSDLLRLQGF